MNRFPLIALLAAIGIASAATAQLDPQTSPDGPLGETNPLSEDEALLDEQTPTYTRYDMVQLRALDKITGRFTDFELTVDEPMVYGSLLINVDACFQTPPEEVPESAAFLRILAADSRQVQTMAVPRRLTAEEKAELAQADVEESTEAPTEPADEDTEVGEPELYFSGWMYASSPGLNALEHPVYDVWVISCSAESPETPSTGRE